MEHNIWATPPDQLYVGIKEHLSDSPMIKHIKETKQKYKKIGFQILPQASTNETNTELYSLRDKNIYEYADYAP